MTRRARLARLAVPLAVALAAATAPAQEPTPTPNVVGGLEFADEISVTVVNLEVYVRDRDGRPVTDLGPDDFLVLQDGQPREITHFAVFTEKDIPPPPGPSALPTPSPTAAPVTAEEPVRRRLDPISIVIFVDNEHLRPTERARVLMQLRRFLPELIRGPVQVMVVSYQRSLKVELPFTSDLRAVSETLRRLRRVQTGMTDRDGRRKELLRDLLQLREKPVMERRRNSFAQADIGSRIRTFAEEWANELDFAMDALRQVITTLSGLPGRKYLVHVSSGLPMVPGRDLMEAYHMVFQDVPVLPMMARYNRRPSWEAIASAANAQGVVFYTIDAHGLGGTAVSAEYAQPVDPMIVSSNRINLQSTLQMLAERTGGRAILDANDITPGLQRLRDDLFVYYSIGYQIGASGADVVHHVEVRLPRHPEYTVRYRRSFVEKSLETRIQDRVVSALTLGAVEDPLGLGVSAGTPVPASEGRWVIPLEITVPLASIALLPDGDAYRGSIVLFVAARDRSGRQSDLERREHTIRVPAADYERLAGRHLTLELRLLMEPGPHKVAVAVLDRITRRVGYRVLPSVVVPEARR